MYDYWHIEAMVLRIIIRKIYRSREDALTMVRSGKSCCCATKKDTHAQNPPPLLAAVGANQKKKRGQDGRLFLPHK